MTIRTGPPHPWIAEQVQRLALVDHHVHGAFATEPTWESWSNALIEADTDPCTANTDPLNSQIGMAVRAWCSPVLDLPRHSGASAYFARRTELGESEVNRRFLASAGVASWLVDTGYSPMGLLEPAAMETVSGRPAYEVVRLERLAQEVADVATSEQEYAAEFRLRLANLAPGVVAAKTIAAYRCGFDHDFSRPNDRHVAAAFGRWARTADFPQFLADPTLIAFGIHEAIAVGLPIQFHVGLGDRDMDLRHGDPLLLTDFLRIPEVRKTSIVLLHCYPYERNAGYLVTVIATASNPKFSVSRVDVDRDGPTYTIDTLDDLHKAYPRDELYFITGADALAEILSWKDAERLFDLAHFIGVTRPGHELTDIGLPVDRVTLLEVPAMAISSTDCRARVAQSEPIWYLVPDGVVQYINKFRLYAPLAAEVSVHASL